MRMSTAPTLRYLSPYLREEYTWTVPGKPIPAPRLTQKAVALAVWAGKSAGKKAPVLTPEQRKKVQIVEGYRAFKQAIVAKLLDAYPSELLFPQQIVTFGKPFRMREGRSGACAIVEYGLYYPKAQTGRCVHGDPDNVVKTIFDALFYDDRHVLPRCMVVECETTTPRTDITVKLLRE